MAKRIKSGIKQHRQSLKRRDRNTVVKSDLKSQVKKINTVINSGDLNAAGAVLIETEAKLKKAASKGVISKKTASRKTGRLAKRVHQLSKSASAPAS
ncbi:MAG: 30S ribosomal protein S20 [Candidatus Dadabacteria bacterium]|nr:MAG: 30S ribosomal protein S20 [Candidatus Dadabacteria bacterium]